MKFSPKIEVPGKWTIDVDGTSYPHATEFSVVDDSPWCSFNDQYGVQHVLCTSVHAIAEKSDPAYYGSLEKEKAAQT